MPVTPEIALGYLQNSLQAERLAHAYLITGGRGAGKERFARQFVELARSAPDADLLGISTADVGDASEGALAGCEGDAVTIIRPGSKSRRIKIDTIRELEKRLRFASSGGARRIGIVVDAERMVPQAQNAFLKTLEEPPDGVHILLLSSYPEQLLTTILSRCIQIPLMPGTKGIPEGPEAEILAALSGFVSGGGGTNSLAALGIGVVLADVLKKVKAEIEGGHNSSFKAERKQYGQATDGTWLSSREDQHKAEAEGEYRDRIRDLVGLVYSWLGDALRQAQGSVDSAALDLPTEAATTAAFAKTQSRGALLARVAAAEEMIQNLQTNAQEQLVLEVGLLRSLG